MIKQNWLIVGWLTVGLMIAILSFFLKANYQVEINGDSSALNFLQQKGEFILEDAQNSFSIAHASRIALREIDTVFDGSDYNVHFRAKTIRFKEIEVSEDAQIRISAVQNALILSMSNVELGTLFQLTGLRSITVRDNANDALMKIAKSTPLETASIFAKKSSIDYQTSLFFNQGYLLRIKNLLGAELDFSQSISGAGYRNSLNHLEISSETDRRYGPISSYVISFKQIDELEIKSKEGRLNFKVVGMTKKLRINGVDVRQSLYDHYIQPSGLAHLVFLLAWLVPLASPILRSLLKQKR